MHRTIRPYELLEPQTLGEALQLLSEHRDKAKVLAGGLDLISKMRRWQIKPQYLVSIQRIPELKHVTNVETGDLAIGAMTTLRDLELSPVIQKDWRLLYEVIHQIASVQVKTMGTVVGNLCVATPASDIAPALFVLGSKLEIVSTQVQKVVLIDKFFIPGCQSILKPNQIVIELRLPKISEGTGTSFQKLAHTKACIAKVNVAVLVTLTNGICSEVRIALGAVASTIIRAKEAEKLLKGKCPVAKLVEEVASMAAEEASPITDLRSTADYRKEMVRVLVKRAVSQALQKAKS